MNEFDIPRNELINIAKRVTNQVTQLSQTHKLAVIDAAKRVQKLVIGEPFLDNCKCLVAEAGLWNDRGATTRGAYLTACKVDQELGFYARTHCGATITPLYAKIVD